MPTIPAESLPSVCLGATTAEIQAATGLAEKTSGILARFSAMNAEEFAEAQRNQLQPILHRLAEKINRELDDMKPAQAAIVYGIMADKLANQPKVLNQALHLHIKGDAGSALSAILGPAAKSVFAVQPVQHGKEPNYLPGSGPVIEADATVSEGA